jgi:hypothetical protein
VGKKEAGQAFTQCLLIRNKDGDLAYITMRRGNAVGANEEAPMGRKGWTSIIAMSVGAIIGVVIGYGIVQSALGAALGAVIGAGIVAGGFGLGVLVPGEVWVALAEFGQIAECCSSFVVLAGACIVTLGGLLLWHSLTLAALAGVGGMTVLLVVLSAGARSYKDASAVQ